MITITLYNDFHNKEHKMTIKKTGKVVGEETYGKNVHIIPLKKVHIIPLRRIKESWKHLCGIKACECCGYAGERGKQRYKLDYIYGPTKIPNTYTAIGAYIFDTFKNEYV